MMPRKFIANFPSPEFSAKKTTTFEIQLIRISFVILDILFLFIFYLHENSRRVLDELVDAITIGEFN